MLTLKTVYSLELNFVGGGGVFKVRKEDKDQESIQSSTTPDPGYQWKVTKSQLDITNESQEVSPFPAGDHKASQNRRA